MSLHVPLHPDALERLRIQRRNSTWSAVVMSLLVLVLFGLALGIFLLDSDVKDEPVLVTYPVPSVEEAPVEQRRMSHSVRRQPPAPSSAMARNIAANRVAPVSIPIPEIDAMEPFLDFGEMHDFGGEWGSGAGDGAGGGGGGFGASEAIPGGLVGRLYDFKQRPDGTAISYQLEDPAEFVDRVVRLQRANFSDAALARHFQAPRELHLTHLAIPLTDAASGPEFFGAEGVIEPSGWIARYRGTIRAPKDGSFRFVGLGDDYLAVFLRGRMRLAACWPDIQEAIGGRWRPGEPDRPHASPFSGVRLVQGDWVRMREGEELEIDLVIGERPGGKVGFVLMIEERGAEYRRATDGRPLLPLFTTAPFGSDERERITRDFGDWEFEWDEVPVFGAR